MGEADSSTDLALGLSSSIFVQHLSHKPSTLNETGNHWYLTFVLQELLEYHLWVHSETYICSTSLHIPRLYQEASSCASNPLQQLPQSPLQALFCGYWHVVRPEWADGNI